MKKLLMAVAILWLSTSSFAAKKNLDDDYDDTDFYKPEGTLILRVKASGLMTKAKNKSLPTDPYTVNTRKAAQANYNSPVKVGSLISNGYGIDTAATMFFGDNFAGEIGAGLTMYRTSSGALSAIGNNYAKKDKALSSKRRNVYAIPLTIALQYHVAPFGAVRPYLGGGLQYTYALSKSQQFNIGSAGGYLLQAGVDFAMTDATVISLDVKHYKFQPKVTYKSSFLGGEPSVSSRLKINPVVVSVGMGWKF